MMLCTTKLELGSCARAVYDWEGNEVKQLDDGTDYFTQSLVDLFIGIWHDSRLSTAAGY